MANTKIPVELSSTPGIVDGSNATAITIDSSENVGIGTSSPSRLLETVATNAGADITALQVRNNNASTSTSTSIRFVNSTSGTSTAGGGEISAVRNSSDGGELTFKTAADSSATLTERMQIDSSGNVTKPAQPHIYGSPNHSSGAGIADLFEAHSSLSRNTITVSTVSSQKRFIAPVSGVYHISLNMIMDQTSNSRKDGYILVNGTTVAQTLNDTNTSGYHYRGQSITVDLDANDYVTVSSDDWYDYTTTGYNQWRTFSMVLLG